MYARELEVYSLLRDMQGGFQPRIFAALYDAKSQTTALLMEDLGELPKREEFALETIRRALAWISLKFTHAIGATSRCAPIGGCATGTGRIFSTKTLNCSRRIGRSWLDQRSCIRATLRP